MLERFITRPILAAVIAILIALVGILSLTSLPISQYPDVVPPTIQVSAYYPGANAEDVQKTVSVPLEEQINGVDNMMYMTSQCANDGSCNITVYFEVGTDPDMATVNVQNRAQRAMNLLPQEVIQGGVTVQKKSPSILALYSLVSTDTSYDIKFLANYLKINVISTLKRVNGVGDVTLFGGDDYAMRIWLNPERMAGLGLTTQDVQNAIKDQNLQAAAGMIGKSPTVKGQETSMMLRVQGRLADEEEFGNIIIKANLDGSMVRMKDIARIELGMKSYDAYSRFNGKSAPAIGIYQAPGSNALAVRDECDKIMKELSTQFPLGITYEKGLDTVEFVEASIEEVLITLIEAFILVFIVVFIFLQDWRATLIPAITVPVSLIGALAAFTFFNFSINLLTLFALVLAIGIVVDDAIVVLEAVKEKIDHEGISPLEATKHTMKEITGAIVTITMVLCAVFVPVSFLGGTTGVMYKQFALTLISSILISALLALTLSPPLCVLLLKAKKERKSLIGKFFNGFDRTFDKTTHGYIRIIEKFTHHLIRPVMFLGVVTVLMLLVMKFLPTGFIPSEDQGYFFINIATPKATSLEKTDLLTRQVEQILLKTPGIQSFTMIPGYSILDGSVSTTNAMAFVKLTHWKERKADSLSAENIIRKVQARFSRLPGGICMAFNAPAISGLGKTGGLELQIEDKAGMGIRKMAEVNRAFYAEASKRKELTNIYTAFRIDIPQIQITVDKEKAKKMGVPVSSIYSSLQGLFGSIYVNDFNKFGKSYRVIIQADAAYRANKEDIANVYVKSATGQMVPLGTLISLTPVEGPEVVKRFNLFGSVDYTIAPAEGFSTGQAIGTIKEVAEKTLPYGFGYEYSGMTRQELISGGQAPFIFALCFIFVYFLLAAKYESWLLPIPILLALPFGIFGAFAFQWIRGLQNNLYAQIGLIMLIGLIAKNAILIVEFAKQKHDQGMPLTDAAREGAKLRFRPILMTSFAFILGVTPLVLASGAGAASRHALGTSVFGGMLFATICGVMVVPSLYVVFQKLEDRMKRKKKPPMSTLVMIGISLLFLSGCKIGPNYKQPEINTGASYRFSTQQGVSSFADTSWSLLFKDPVLNDMIRRGLENNFDLKIAFERVNQSRSLFKQTRADLYPYVGLAGVASYNNQQTVAGNIVEYHDYYGIGTLSWELDIWGKIRRARESARADMMAAEANRQAIQLSLIAEIATAYFDLLEYQDELQITRYNAELRQKSLDLVKNKLVAGTVSGLVVAQAESELEQVLTQIPAYEKIIAMQENGLKLLTGELPGPVVTGDTIINQVNRDIIPLAGIPSRLIVRRPDIIAAEQQLISANAQVGVARGMMLPTLAITADIGYSDLGAGVISSAVGSLVAPIFNMGKLKANLRRAQSKKEEMLITYRKAIYNGLREVSNGIISVQKQQEVVEESVKLTAVAQHAYDLSAQLFNAGYASYLDVLNAQRTLYQAQVYQSQEYNKEMKSIVDLYLALGGGWK